MRIIALFLISASLGAAEMRQLGPTEDLPYCRVTENSAASIDRDAPLLVSHDGWYCAQTRQLFPISSDQGLFVGNPLDSSRIVSVQQASRKPGPMPAEWRKQLNDYIAKNHPQVPDTDPMPAAASPAHVAAKP